jgi:hypothetical protein
MNTSILEYKKSKHFLYSQWDRVIKDQMLKKILPFVECSKCEKDVIIVEPAFLKKKNIIKEDNIYLVVIIKKRLLLTAYWCDYPDYLYKKEKEAHFQRLK